MPMRAENTKKPKTWKRMLIMIGLVLLLIAIIAGVKVLLVMRMLGGMKPPPPAVVTATTVSYQDWQPAMDAVGSLRAVRGADLAFDVAGLVTAVNVESGAEVKKGQLLMQLRDDDDVARLRQLESAAALAEVTFGRAKRQLALEAISKADYDAAAADLKGKQANVRAQQAEVAKKQLRAPFDGRVGIVTISPGTYLNAGTIVVTVQQVDSLFADFNLPQRDLADLKVGQKVLLQLDAFPERRFTGELTAISPKIDVNTRNVQVEATVPNVERSLAPGMFARVSIDVGGTQRYLTLPQTAVVYNPYGETVFVVMKKSEADKQQAAAQGDASAKAGNSAKAAASSGAGAGGKGAGSLPPDALVVQQRFVTTGATRGDQVAIVKGLDEGAQVVTSGQIKLKNGAPVTIDNSQLPADNPSPTPQEN